MAHPFGIQIPARTIPAALLAAGSYVASGHFGPMVDGEIISQGQALNRGVLTQAVIEAGVQQSQVQGIRVYGKPGCPYCVRAKQQLEAANLDYHYEDVVATPNALYEMLALVKPIVGPKTPITVPQIWFDGKYVGGADQLAAFITK